MAASGTTMALTDAYLCAECNRIGESAVRCPSCACEHGLLPPASVLNREFRPAEHVAALIEQLDAVLN